MELDFKDVISDIYNKEKILNKNINNVTKEKVDKLFEVMSMLFTEDKEKLNYFFSNFDNESLSSLLDTQTTLKTLLNDWNSFIDRKTRLEKEENHLEKDFLLIVNEQQQKVSTIIPKSLKKAIKADEYRKEMYEKIENKDYNGLDFLEEEAVTRMMSVVQKFNKETSDNALNDNIVKNFLRNKSFTCFS
ncbi:hypothetical protein HOG21_07890 [bacterium]|nr:hypothetical protein [bacterium]